MNVSPRQVKRSGQGGFLECKGGDEKYTEMGSEMKCFTTNFFGSMKINPVGRRVVDHPGE